MDVTSVKLSPEIRQTISVEELAKHLFSVMRKAESEPRWYRNYPTILRNLLLDLCLNPEGNFSQDQVNRFSPKFDEAITLLKELRLIVDVTTADIPTVRLSSLGEESDGQEITQQGKEDLQGGMAVGEAFTPILKVSEDKAKQAIGYQIERGYEVRDRSFDEKDWDALELAYRDFHNWLDVIADLLIQIFSDGTLAEEYAEKHGFGPKYFKSRSGFFSFEVGVFRREVDNCVAKLLAILEKVDMISKFRKEIVNVSVRDNANMRSNRNSVFIVHGRDSVRYQLKDLLRDWGIEPIELEELPSRGRTVIEKFEEHSSAAECAIVLLTPDDEGRLADTQDWEPRARQNVILELGYFFAKLGRDRVICLYKSDIELPSDISGIIYISFDRDLKNEVYRKLRMELREIGFTIND